MSHIVGSMIIVGFYLSLAVGADVSVHAYDTKLDHCGENYQLARVNSVVVAQDRKHI